MSRDAATSVNDWQNYETAAGTNPVASAKLQLNGHDRFYQREGKYEPKTSQKKQSFWLVIALRYCNMSGCKKPAHNRNICYHPTEEILRRTVVTPHPNGQNTYVRVICRRLAKSRYAREQQAFQRSQRHREEQLSKLPRVLKARSGPIRWKSIGFYTVILQPGAAIQRAHEHSRVSRYQLLLFRTQARGAPAIRYLQHVSY